MSTSPVAEHEIRIPSRAVRRPDAAPDMARPELDPREDETQLCFEPLVDRRPHPKHSAIHTGVYFVGRAEVTVIAEHFYPTMHAKDSKTEDLKPNNPFVASIKPLKIATKLRNDLGVNFDGVQTGFVILEPMSGFEDQRITGLYWDDDPERAFTAADALQFLTFALIPNDLFATREALARRLGKSVDEVAAIAVEEIQGSGLAADRKESMKATIAKAVGFVKAASRIRKRSCADAIAESIKVMYDSTATAERYAEMHLQRTERELDNSIGGRPGKNLIDDYDVLVYRMLRRDVPQKSSNNLHRPTGTAAPAAAPAPGPFKAGQPMTECIDCMGLIPVRARVCGHCKCEQWERGAAPPDIAPVVVPAPEEPPVNPDEQTEYTEPIGEEFAEAFAKDRLVEDADDGFKIPGLDNVQAPAPRMPQRRINTDVPDVKDMKE